MPVATSRAQLKQRIITAWERLGTKTENIKNLCDSMKDKVTAVINAGGGPTKY